MQNHNDELAASSKLLEQCVAGSNIKNLAEGRRNPEKSYTRISELLTSSKDVSDLDTSTLAELLRQTRTFSTPAGLSFQRHLYQHILAKQPNRPSIRARLMAVELMLDPSPLKREEYAQAIAEKKISPDLVLRYLSNCSADELVGILNGTLPEDTPVLNLLSPEAKEEAIDGTLEDAIIQAEIAIQKAIQENDDAAVRRIRSAIEERCATSTQAMVDKRYWDLLSAFEERVQIGADIHRKLLTTSIANLEWYFRWLTSTGRYATEVECAQWFSVSCSSARSYPNFCGNIVLDIYQRNPSVAHLVALAFGIETIGECAERVCRKIEKEIGIKALQDLMHNGMLPALTDDGYIRLARIARKERQYSFSLKLLSRCKESAARDSQQARILYDTNQLLDAIEVYERLLDATPTDTEALRGLIQTRRLLGVEGDIDVRIEKFLAGTSGKEERLPDVFHLGVSLKRRDLIKDVVLSTLKTSQNRDLLGKMASYLLDNDDTLLGWQCVKPLADDARWTALHARYQAFFQMRDIDPDAGRTDEQPLPLIETVIRRLLEMAPAARPAPSSPKLAILLPSIGSGGIQRQVFNLMTSFVAAEKFETPPVIMPMAEDKLGFYQQEVDRLNLTKIPAPPETFDFDELIALGQSREIVETIQLLPQSMAVSIGYFLKNFLVHDTSIAHCWYDSINCLGGVAAALAGTNKIILGARSVAPRGRRSADPYMYDVYRALLELPSASLTAVADACRQDFLDWLAVPDEKVHLIYNGIQLDGIQAQRNPAKSDQIRKEIGANATTPVFGSAFRFSKEKRPLLMLEAAAELIKEEPAAKFIMVGDGRLRPTVEAYAQQLGISNNVILPGVQKDIIPWFDAMNIIVLLSTFEGTANIAIEAQALGKPVVLTDAGGLRETFIDGKTGFLLAADPSPKQVAEAMLASWREQAGNQDAQELAISHVRERFSPASTARQTEEIYFS